MALYHYTGVDRKNKQVQGEIWAENKKELQEELEVFGIFLTSWNVVEKPASRSAAAPPSADTSPGEEPEYEARDMGEMGARKKVKWLPRKPIHFVLLGASVVGGVLLGQWVYSPHPEPTFLDAPLSVRPTLSAIKPGTTREEVEKLALRKDKGNQYDMITRYFIPPSTWIWVSYDQTGGEWSPSNRVICWPYVSATRAPTGLTAK